MKKRIAVLFGGKSPEHEVSIITGLQAIENFDKEKYEVIPVYITKDGIWYTGDELTKIETYRNLQNIHASAKQITISLDASNNGFIYTAKKSANPFAKTSEKEIIDVIFPAFHGGLGENGGVVGLFELMHLPYAGPGITGGVLGMDKVIMKQVLEQSGAPISKWIWFYKLEWEENRNAQIDKIEKILHYPIFVKPANGGSSIGTTKAHNRKELENAIEVAAVFDAKIIVEEGIEKAREINISVLGNAGSTLKTSVCEEVFATAEILSYEDKYLGNSKSGKSKGMASTNRQIPAILPEKVVEEIENIAKKVFNLLNASGVSRIDFLYKENTQEIFVIEINTIPGSLAFYLWQASGMTFKELLSELINLAYQRFEEANKNTLTFSSNILQNFERNGVKGKV